MHPAISGLVREVFYPFLEDGDELRLRESKKHRLSTEQHRKQVGDLGRCAVDEPGWQTSF